MSCGDEVSADFEHSMGSAYRSDSSAVIDRSRCCAHPPLCQGGAVDPGTLRFRQASSRESQDEQLDTARRCHWWFGS
jgi:hypothetical protein